ncbi:hypothetical protein O181_071378 [Austropuccinia psidii MF-1]|uniref:Uncharacterized protein n=1 Tax=Austropuccinia psidii MF-1 TaxID=1389203 RepID=A0A9Q3F0X4_9BASI|nr:hypothetical protein [Austropuccinia psidii MF-1]
MTFSVVSGRIKYRAMVKALDGGYTRRLPCLSSHSTLKIYLLHFHPSLCFRTPAVYNAYAPAGPSRYSSDTATQCWPSPILTLPNTHCVSCLFSLYTLKICLQHFHLMSSLTHPYTSVHLPLTMLKLQKDPLDMPLTLQPNVCPHPSLFFRMPAAYHSYAPIAPSRYASDSGTPYLPSPILTLPHTRLIFSATYHAYAHVLDSYSMVPCWNT